MYFPGDPLFFQDPIFNSVRDPTRPRADGLAASTSTETEPEWALAYQFDIVLRGREATPMEELSGRSAHARRRPSGRSSRIGLPYEGDGRSWCRQDDPDAIRIEGIVLDGDGEPVPDALVEIWQANRGRALRPPRGHARGVAARGRLPRLRPLRDRRRRGASGS